MIQPRVYPHIIAGKPDVALYSVGPCDPSQPCDLTCNQWSWELKDNIQQVATAASSSEDATNQI